MARRRLTAGAGSRRVVLAVLLLCGLLLGLTAPDAQAISRSKAKSIALKALKPKRTGDVVVFGLRKPIPARRRIHDVLTGKPPKGRTGRPQDPTTGLVGKFTRRQPTSRPSKRSRAVSYRGNAKRVHTTRGRTWVFWMDRRYGMRFPRTGRTSTIVLIDHRTGRVVRKRSLAGEPSIDGRVPVFLSRSNYLGKRYRVFASDGVIAAERRRTSGSGDASRGFTADPPGKAAATRALAAEGSCMLLLGHQTDPKAFGDVPAMAGALEALGVKGLGTRVQVAAGRTPTRAQRERMVDGSVIAPAVAKLKSDKCKDIFIYITGHGASKGPAVEIANYAAPTRANPNRRVKHWVTARHVTAVLDAHPDLTFKFKIDACFSGTWRTTLIETGKDEDKDGKPDPRKNVTMVETSSSATQKSYFHKKSQRLPGGKKPPKGVKVETRRGRRYMVNTSNPRKVSEFTNRNLDGLKRFLDDGGLVEKVEKDRNEGRTRSFLTTMFGLSFFLGASADFASVVGLTTPGLFTDNLIAQPPPPPPQPPPAVTPPPPQPPPPPPPPCSATSTDASGTYGPNHLRFETVCSNGIVFDQLVIDDNQALNFTNWDAVSGPTPCTFGSGAASCGGPPGSPFSGGNHVFQFDGPPSGATFTIVFFNDGSSVAQTTVGAP